MHLRAPRHHPGVLGPDRPPREVGHDPSRLPHQHDPRRDVPTVNMTTHTPGLVCRVGGVYLGA